MAQHTRRINWAWTEENRLCLHLLKSEFKLTLRQQRAVFAIVFSLDDVSSGKLNSQYATKERHNTQHAWQFLQTGSSSRSDNFRTMKKRITRAIDELETSNDSDTDQDTYVQRTEPDTVAGSYPATVRKALTTYRRARGSRASRKTQGNARRHVAFESSSQSAPEYGEDVSPTQANSSSDVHTPVPTSVQPLNTLLWPEKVPPRPSVLYRFDIVGKSNSPMNDAGEFVAGRFRNIARFMGVPPAPTRENPGSLWQDMFSHYNRDHIDSPFISTSASLSWILELAVKQRLKGEASGRLSMILVDDMMTLYHARSFFMELRRVHRSYDPQNFIGNSSSKWVVHRKTRPCLSIDFGEVLKWAAKSPEVAHTLHRARLDDTEENTTARASFKKREIVTLAFVDKVAELLLQALHAKMLERTPH